MKDEKNLKKGNLSLILNLILFSFFAVFIVIGSDAFLNLKFEDLDSGGDILPALEAGTIDAAEWCCPKPDMTFGFQKVLKHYYLQGLHQVVVNADFYLTGSKYKKMSAIEKKALEVAANASLSKSMSYRIYENGKALAELTTKHGVILHDTPADYFPAYMAAAKASLEKNAAKNKFFAQVWQSQKDFADIAVPFWSGSQMSNAKLGMAHAETLK